MYKAKCEFEDDLVSYLYNEMEEPLRPAFENHLAVCGSCTDEFAEIADSRFSVFEWQKEFALIPTPEIKVPQRVAKHTFADGIRSFVSGISWPARVAVPAFAVLLVVATMWFGVRTGSNDGRPATVSAPVTVALREDVLPTEPSLPDPGPAEPAAVKITDPHRPAPAHAALKIVSPAPLRPAKQLEADDTIPVTKPLESTVRRPARPTLTGDEDDAADNSLRLADLFADADSIR